MKIPWYSLGFPGKWFKHTRLTCAMDILIWQLGWEIRQENFFLNNTSEDVQFSHWCFHRNLFGWPLWRRQCPSISISSIQSVKVAAEVEDRGTVDGALVRGCSSGSQPAPVGGGPSRWRCAAKLIFVKFTSCQYGVFDIYLIYLTWNIDIAFWN